MMDLEGQNICKNRPLWRDQARILYLLILWDRRNIAEKTQDYYSMRFPSLNSNNPWLFL